MGSSFKTCLGCTCAEAAFPPLALTMLKPARNVWVGHSQLWFPQRFIVRREYSNLKWFHSYVLRNASPKENFIHIFKYSQNWGQQPCNRYGRGSRGKKSTVKCTSLHSILDNGWKQSQSFLREIYIARNFFIKIAQYLRHMYERSWNVASYSERGNPSRNSHAELNGCQSLEEGKRTRDHQPVHSSAAFANFPSNDCWHADQQNVMQLSKFVTSLNDLLAPE